MPPGEIPQSIHVDVKDLHLGKFLRLSEIGIDETKFKIVSDREKVVAHVTHGHKEEVAATEETAAAAGPAEPEVIKKGKKEEEGAVAEAKPAKK